MPATAPAQMLSHCIFTPSGDHFTGSCGKVFDEDAVLTLAPRATIEGGIWREGAVPIAIWGGGQSDADDRDAPIQLEIYQGDSGLLRTVYGWFPVSGYRESANALSFDFNASQEVLPNALDAKILERAAAILSSDAVWNRKDNRKCSAGGATLSIYCAAERACKTLEVIRGVVDDWTRGRNYQHRLMDYNNDPTTTLADVHSLFARSHRSDERQGLAAEPRICRLAPFANEAPSANPRQPRSPRRCVRNHAPSRSGRLRIRRSCARNQTERRRISGLGRRAPRHLGANRSLCAGLGRRTSRKRVYSMETDVRTKFTALLAERGLTLAAFDGKTLIVHYDAEGDSEVQKGHAVNAASLSRYVQDVIAQHPGSETMFPGLVDVEVELSATR